MLLLSVFSLFYDRFTSITFLSRHYYSSPQMYSPSKNSLILIDVTLIGRFNSFLTCETVINKFLCSGQTGLLSGDVAPLLDDGFLDRLGVSSGPGAHLLGHVHTLLGGDELGDQLGHVLAVSLWLQRALLLGFVLDDSLDLVMTELGSGNQFTACWGTELPWLLGAGGHRRVLLHGLLGHAAHLSGRST